MAQPGSKLVAAPSFALITRQPIRPAALLLAILTVTAALFAVLYALNHARHPHLADTHTAGAPNNPDRPDNPDEPDDPSQIDTIVLGDPADAPVPARRGNHVSPVHPTILVHLPRFGDQTGLIPNSDAGRLLYAWLAAFNQANPTGLANALPSLAPESTAAAQMQLRKQTGGFALLSAKEIQPGILVFRLRDQTPAATEVLGTLQLNPNQTPNTIATFSLRAIPPTPPNSPTPPLP